MTGTTPSHDAIAEVFREESGVVLASLIARFRDFDLAEEALQDAFTLALQRWPGSGVPERPAAWLTATARNRVLDRIRHDGMRAGKALDLRLTEEERRQAEDSEMDAFPDERLSLIFTCCHPALAPEAQVALTLRTLGGLSTDEVASAFLVNEKTMGRRLARAKKKIRDARIPYRVPEPDKLEARLGAVLAVLYLIFNEGYSARRGDAPVRRELSGEAIRLAHVLASLIGEPSKLQSPGLQSSALQSEVHGLLALMLLHDARRDARVVDGVLVPLEEQDRGRWDAQQIAEGLAVLVRAEGAGPVGSYRLQASISAVHAKSLLTGEIDWPAIVGFYDELVARHASPVIALNRAVAVARAEGADAGLLALESLTAQPGVRRAMESYQPFYAAMADLQSRAGNVPAARDAYQRAIDLCEVEAERAFLVGRRDALAH